MQNFVFSLTIIISGLMSGYVFQVLLTKNILGLKINIQKLKRVLQIIALLILNPIAFLGAVWILPLDDLRIISMPFIGALTIIMSGLLGLGIGKLAKLPAKQRGAFFSVSAMSNIGSIGALLVFVFLGEAGFALVPFYKIFEELLYYSIGFPVARSFSANKDTAKQKSEKSPFLRVITDPFILVALISIGTGFILNNGGITRPVFYADLNSYLVPIASFLLLFSIGLSMRFGNIFAYWKTSVAAMGIKFILAPLWAVGIAVVFGLQAVDEGIPLKVVLILASMPSGFISMVPPSLYDLDVDLANSAWFFTTFGLILTVPILSLII